MPRSNHRTDLTTFKALDDLPPALFREVCFAARVWDAKDILALYQDAKRKRGTDAAIAWLTASIEGGDEADVLDFAFKYQLRHKMPLPHLAAQATILRYLPPVAGRRMGRPADRRVRAAWVASERLMPR
jgi:hypothetical protein